jgi:pimeloyl-ACP methyl ester carboxylesterase
MDLYVKETGSENAETIILLHGGAMAGWMWDEQIDSFKDYHCIVPDLPEHGLSTSIKPFTIKRAAELVIDIIKKRGKNGKAHMVGISLGAQIIVQILNTSPEVVDHAFISGTLTRRIPQTETMLKILDYTFQVYEPVKDSDFFIKANMRTYNMPKNLFEKFKESTHLIKASALSRILQENMLFKLPEGLEKVESPVLIMTGEKDYKIVKESATDIINSLPRSKGYMAPKLGHAWNLEDPKLFNYVLRRFINDEDIFDDLLPLKN